MTMELQEVFAINPELAGPTPRPVRYVRETQIIRRGLMTILIGSMTVVFGLAKHNLDDIHLLKQNGVTTQGMIFDKKYVPGGRSSSYAVEYRYNTGQQSINDRLTISSQDYEQAEIGDPITVTFLPSRPTLHRVGNVTQDDITEDEAHWAFFLLLIFACIGGICFHVEMKCRENRKLLRDGSVALGTVISHRIIQNQLPTYCLTYQFTVGNSTRRKEIDVSRVRYERWPEGTRVTILYDMGNLTNNTVYQLLPDVTLDSRI